MGDKKGSPYDGGMLLNTVVTFTTFAIVFGLPKLLDAMGKGHMKKIPAVNSVLVNLNIAVAAFTVLFFVGRLVVDIPDMKTTAELKDVADESDAKAATV